MDDYERLQLVAFGMCLANKKLATDSKPETFGDEGIRNAIAELQAGKPDAAVAKLLADMGCETKRWPGLADAVLGAVKEFSEFLGWKKTGFLMAGPMLTGRAGTAAGRRAYVEECKAKTDQARGET